MNFEKLVNSKINVVADWIIRLVILNVLIIFFSLPIITIYPAVSAGYNMFNDYVNQKNTKLFQGFFTYFKEALGRKMLLSVIIVLVFVLGYSNIRFYSFNLENDPSIVNNLGYYITLSLLAIWYAITVYTIIVNRVNSKMKLMSLFKLSFFMAGKYYFITLALVVVNSLPIVLLFFPQTVVFFILMGISLPLMINAFLTRGAVFYLENLGEKND